MGTIDESHSAIVTSPKASPSASVATCARTVSDPCPISAAAIIRVAPSPSSRIRMIAFECGKELR